MSHITPTRHKPPSWRDTIPIHPTAALFPRPSDDELTKLGADIRERGVLFPIAFYRDRDGTDSLLDGISRLDAMERAGVEFEITPKKKIPYLRVHVGDNPDAIGLKETRCVLVQDDPHGYVVAVNIRRRHLTAEQKRDLIAKLLKLDAGKSDRQVAKLVGADHKTVAAVRAKSNGEIPHKDRTEASGRKARGRKPNNKPEPEQIGLEEAIAAVDAEPSAASRKAAYAAEELNNGALPPEDTPGGDVAKTAFTALCLLVLAANRDPHLADHLVAIAAAQAPDPFPSIERLIEVLIEVDGRLRGPEGNHAEPPAGDDPGPMPEFLRRRRAS